MSEAEAKQLLKAMRKRQRDGAGREAGSTRASLIVD